MLKNLKFDCRNKVDGCGIKPLGYEQASSHIKYCKFQVFDCPFNCLDENNKCKKIQGSNLEQHIKIDCPEIVEECEKCGIDKKIKDSHDCFDSLKKQIKEKGEQANETKQVLGIDY